MGIPMDDNIHAPTVPSGPASGGEKERIEAELSALSSVLSSHGVNMNTSLTTFDGFPRDDIDIAQIRTTRARIIHLRTDHKEVMKRLEGGLHEHFANLQRAQGATATDTTAMGNAQAASTGQPARDNLAETGMLGRPFARVNSVVPDSPAAQAGLQAGDTIRSFGGVHWMNHERLSRVAQVVQQSEGRPLTVKVVRKEDSGPDTTELDLQLTPRQGWGGRGLLGCHLVPL
ncbi:hypothetical protein ASPZODRAFT_1397650 [Penicilliopsis zonata CBS 506.65]|uniref:Probable 26S proteasome regulatory subunit p27 n=1 Tax=Penicilliopsis zonata CBS 506.65 TaxID=1073090 RepID=A0A1L9SPX7_9EURO|nr:hypothetical protein ASPZODRAFT_1397650 [Penicilliopsis zonata CBS 506.65]OJJ49107.1 hypothetical protein ASPZODRAFT_1397650 [Penicilliopsis zonata CBS 506.65]